MRLIDADELSKWISGQIKSPSCPKNESAFGLRIMKHVDRMPSVQSEPCKSIENIEVARWVNAEKPISITWSDKTARKTKLYCRKSGYLCEFATEYGYCQITMCVKEPLAGRRTDG